MMNRNPSADRLPLLATLMLLGSIAVVLAIAHRIEALEDQINALVVAGSQEGAPRTEIDAVYARIQGWRPGLQLAQGAAVLADAIVAVLSVRALIGGGRWLSGLTLLFSLLVAALVLFAAAMPRGSMIG